MRYSSGRGHGRGSSKFVIMCRAALASCAAAVAVLGVSGTARAGVYEQRFSGYTVGTTTFGPAVGELTESNFQALPFVAAVRDEAQRELQLTAYATTSTRAAFRLPDLDPGRPVQAFSARWNAQVYGSTTVADGFSLSFGNLPADLVSFSRSQEDGYGTGLTVGVRTYAGSVNGVPAQPGVRAFVAGQQRAFAPPPAWGFGNFARHYWEVDWTAADGLTLRLDGQTYLDRVATTGFTPAAGMRFAFAARTGGTTEEVRLDNVAVVTGGTLRAVPMNAATATATGGSWDHERAPKAFDGNPGFGMVSATESLAGTTKWVANAINPVIGATTADGLPRRVSAYTIVSGNDATGRYPRNWTLQGSNDGVAWSVLDTVADEASAHSYNTPRTYAVDAPGDFARYRLAITANNGASTLYQIGDILLYETVIPEPTACATVAAGLLALARPRRRPSRKCSSIVS